MSLSDQINTLQTHLDTAKNHTIKLESGTKASASKLRASLQLIKKESQALRLMAMEHVKSLPTKSRTTHPAKKTEKFDPLPPEPEPEPLIEPPPKKKRVRKPKSDKK